MDRETKAALPGRRAEAKAKEHAMIPGYCLNRDATSNATYPHLAAPL